MSARSASARKKVTNVHSKTKKSDQSSRSRIRPGNVAPGYYYDHYPYHGGGQGPGAVHYDMAFPLPSGAHLVSRGTASVSGHSNGSGSHSGPSEPDADGTAIERSGFRNMMDKRSDGVRRGLAKTFAFKKKEKDDFVSRLDRPESQATVRQGTLGLDTDGYGYDDYQPTPCMGMQRPLLPHQYPSFQQPPHHQPYPVSPQEPPEMKWPGPPPSTKLPPIPQGGGPLLRRFVGAGRPASRWNKLRKDPELWDPNGDVLVYLGHKEHGEPPNLRLSSHIIEAAKNRHLVALLRDDFVQDLDEPHSPRSHGSYWGQLTPPVSETDEVPGSDISYEMYFPPPPSNSRTDIVRHQITTRNIFAVIYRASLVGISLHQALCDLHARLEKYRARGETDSTAQLLSYITARNLDDTRGDVDSTVALLAWTERPGVHWSSGWREAFMHCAGMYSSKLERCADWRQVAPLTRALLERSWLEMRLRVQNAEERLAEFSYGDMWSGSFSPAPSGGSNPPIGSARAAADRLRNFLISHYGQSYGSWPPSTRDSHASDDGEEQMWLTRSVAKSLQHDFGALYDYLVDRDVVWDVSEARAGRKWEMVSKGGNRGFEADAYDIPMTDVLIEFDNRSRIPHMPHPHPLLPESIPPAAVPGNSGGMFKSSSAQPQKHSGRERRVALAYTESTNLDALGSSYSPSSLVDAFVKFEKSDCVGEVDPQMARRGRWVLVYGILQTLAAVGIDAPGIKYRDGATYHLNARLKKPSWSREAGLFVDANHEMSHCWVVPQTWEEEKVEEEEEQSHQEMLLNPRSPPELLSPTASEAGSSVRTSSSAGLYASRRATHNGPDLLELPFRRRDLSSNRSSMTPSMTSLGSFLTADDQKAPKKRAPKGHEAYNETPLLNRGLSPVIRDFDEEP